MAKAALDVHAPTATNIVDPECDIHEIGRTQGLQQPVEGVVPVFEFPFFPADEGQSFEMPGNQIVAFARLHHRGRDMR